MAAPPERDQPPALTRFEFGKNWARFLGTIDDGVIEGAKRSLCEMLELDDLHGKSFLDVGAGSGLFSLAGRELGARVHSFDVDADSYHCTLELRRRYLPEGDDDWVIEQASVLDPAYISQLGQFDIVYAWGIVHHTGDMWQALRNLADLVSHDGLLFISVYNDQGRASRRWRKIKRFYNRLPQPLRFVVLWPVFARLWGPTMFRDLIRAKPLQTWKDYAQNSRGMSPWRDVIDWVGGYPFEVARPEELLDFFRSRRFRLLKLKTCGGGHGCNEFVFSKLRDNRNGSPDG